MIKDSTLSLEEMLDKSNDNVIIDRNSFFEPVKLNVSSNKDINDTHLSSLFGEPDEQEIHTFIYEKVKENKKPFFSNTKIKVASFSILGITITSALFGFFNNLENDGFKANASPMNMVMEQNLSEKTNFIKSQISKGIIASEADSITSYKVKADDTVFKIAQNLNAPTDVIKAINGISTDNDLVGRENILVPLVEGIVHKIKSGETIDTIANKYKTSAEKIVKMNKIKNPNFVSENQVLFIPKKSTQEAIASELKNHKKETLKFAKKQVDSREQHRVHKIGKDQTLEYLSEKYNVSISKILESNKALDPSNIQIGQPIIIPGKAISRNETRNRGVKLSSRSLQAGAGQNGLASSGRFSWPTKGEFSSGYGPRGGSFHRGIDIAANSGTPIYSSLGGIVTHAGTRWEYGTTVEITHSNGMVTRYGHCSKLFVSVGQIVEKGHRIAAMGSTGRSTGPHLHFEILVNGVQVNPRNFL